MDAAASLRKAAKTRVHARRLRGAYHGTQRELSCAEEGKKLKPPGVDSIESGKWDLSEGEVGEPDLAIPDGRKRVTYTGRGESCHLEGFHHTKRRILIPKLTHLIAG